MSFQDLVADIAVGQKLGANSTPTFVLEGEKIENPRSVEAFSQLIDVAISAKNPNDKKTTTPAQ